MLVCLGIWLQDEASDCRGSHIPLRSRDSPQRVLGWLAVRFLLPAVQFWSKTDERLREQIMPCSYWNTNGGRKSSENRPEHRAQSRFWRVVEIHNVSRTQHPNTKLTGVPDGTRETRETIRQGKRGTHAVVVVGVAMW